MEAPTAFTAAPVIIRTVDDINASQDRIKGLAARAAGAAFTYLDDCGDWRLSKATYSRSEALELLEHVLRKVLIDEPATGLAVDIAGHIFESHLRRNMLGFALAELGDSEGEA